MTKNQQIFAIWLECLVDRRLAQASQYLAPEARGCFETMSAMIPANQFVRLLSQHWLGVLGPKLLDCEIRSGEQYARSYGMFYTIHAEIRGETIQEVFLDKDRMPALQHVPAGRVGAEI